MPRVLLREIDANAVPIHRADSPYRTLCHAPPAMAGGNCADFIPHAEYRRVLRHVRFLRLVQIRVARLARLESEEAQADIT